MTGGDACGLERELEDFLGRLDDGRTIFFPIRHHSPACAWHLAGLIRERRPASILIEGPESLGGYLPALADPALQAPVALYSLFIDRRRRTSAARDTALPPPRFGAFYPLCDYSPELVAVREGSAVGARLGFCDLDHAVQTLCSEAAEGSSSLLDETHLANSRYLKELARRRGCRDTDELWDRLFESGFRAGDRGRFIREVAAYCYLGRAHYGDDELRADGNLAREQCMAGHVERERRRLKRAGADGPLLVVTGGFHTPALVAPKRDRIELPEGPRDDERLHALIPYSFRQLDALNGYGAGMPSPGYYQRLWEAEGSGREVLEKLCREMVVELPRETRRRGLALPMSTADAIAAHHQACQLAAFRGNPGPLREDLIDGIRSSLVKGEMDADGRAVLAVVDDLLTGDGTGQVPGHLVELPLLDDFRRQAAELGLKLDDTRPREMTLEIYKSDRHRRRSRFFRSLEFLDVPLARFVTGPDFLEGTGLNLQNERWNYAWSPQTEASLVAASIHGATLAEALVGRLHEREREFEDQGSEVGAGDAVGLLLFCCRLGLHAEGNRFVPLARRKLEEEGNFSRCLEATLRLTLLRRFPGPLEAEKLNGADGLAEEAYRRLCYLLGELAGAADERQVEAAGELASVRGMLRSEQEQLDPAWFHEAAKAAERRPGHVPELAGGLAGFLYAEGLLPRDELLARITARGLPGGIGGSGFSRYLQGVLAQCRELTWQDDAFLERLDDIISGWDEDDFLGALPHLRLAFSGHTPRETDRTSERVAALHGTDAGIDWYQTDLSEAFVAANLALMAELRRCLRDDGLEASHG
ncbi:DUF5682 family protein [Luteolibacter marinus]|uniref:DUF5682 family protein n=1 Tax=Luteolibacter marinus TaxID=2776705 RepID=UPI001866DFCF|nr:DUF5682 family protein [Luteolibacter marinus]